MDKCTLTRPGSWPRPFSSSLSGLLPWNVFLFSISCFYCLQLKRRNIEICPMKFHASLRKVLIQEKKRGPRFPLPRAAPALFSFSKSFLSLPLALGCSYQNSSKILEAPKRGDVVLSRFTWWPRTLMSCSNAEPRLWG